MVSPFPFFICPAKRMSFSCCGVIIILQWPSVTFSLTLVMTFHTNS